MPEEPARRLSRNETHDLGMIIKDRSKVLKAYAEEQAAACFADFERKLATVYSWDQDETWKKAAEQAQAAAKAAQEIVAERCRRWASQQPAPSIRRSPGLAAGENALSLAARQARAGWRSHRSRR